MNKKYKLLIFDMGGTLMQNKKKHTEISFGFLPQVINEDVDDILMDSFQCYFNELRNNIRGIEGRSYEIMIINIFRAVFLRFGLTPTVSYEELEKQFVYENAEFDISPKSQLLFEYLNNLSYTTCVLSNSEITHITLSDILTKTIPLFKFDTVFSSADLIYRKPSHCVFDAVLKKYSLRPGECCMIGNNLDDVIPAIEMGMDAYFLQQSQEPLSRDTPFVVIQSLNELITYI